MQQKSLWGGGGILTEGVERKKRYNWGHAIKKENCIKIEIKSIKNRNSQYIPLYSFFYSMFLNVSPSSFNITMVYKSVPVKETDRIRPDAAWLPLPEPAWYAPSRLPWLRPATRRSGARL